MNNEIKIIDNKRCVEINGQMYSLYYLSKLFNIKHSTLLRRISVQGIDIFSALMLNKHQPYNGFSKELEKYVIGYIQQTKGK